MEKLTITQQHIEAAKAAGACDVSRHRPGMTLAQIPAEHLRWIEDNLPEIASNVAREASKELAGVAGVVPLSLLARDGDGSGDGSGYGYGYGYGDGYGYGYGYGYGDGYGYGYGYGDGSGYGLRDIVLET